MFSSAKMLILHVLVQAKVYHPPKSNFIFFLGLMPKTTSTPPTLKPPLLSSKKQPYKCHPFQLLQLVHFWPTTYVILNLVTLASDWYFFPFFGSINLMSVSSIFGWHMISCSCCSHFRTLPKLIGECGAKDHFVCFWMLKVKSKIWLCKIRHRA